MNTPSPAVEQDTLATQSEPVSELERLRREVADFKSWGVIEVAVRNPNVRSYMDHWEGRTEKAEARISALEAERDELKMERDGLAISEHNWLMRAESALSRICELEAALRLSEARVEEVEKHLTPHYRLVVEPSSNFFTC